MGYIFKRALRNYSEGKEVPRDFSMNRTKLIFPVRRVRTLVSRAGHFIGVPLAYTNVKSLGFR